MHRILLLAMGDGLWCRRERGFHRPKYPKARYSLLPRKNLEEERTCRRDGDHVLLRSDGRVRRLGITRAASFERFLTIWGNCHTPVTPLSRSFHLMTSCFHVLFRGFPRLSEKIAGTFRENEILQFYAENSRNHQGLKRL